MSLVLVFAAIAAALIVVPGPDWAYVLAVGIRDRVVFPPVLGLMIGYALLTSVVAVGVGPVVTTLPWALTALTLGGAAYLCWLGIRTVLQSRASATRDAEGGGVRARRMLIARGIGVSALNPKGLLLFLAILPQFTRTDAAWPVAVQLGALGVVYIVIAGAFYAALGLAGNRVLSARPTIARRLTRVAGIAMIVVAAALAIERLLELLPS